MSIASQAIITRGLSCGTSTACERGTMLIAGQFSLYCLTFKNPRNFHGGGGAGYNHPVRPLQPGEIAQLYQPVPAAQQFYVVPRDQEAAWLRQRIPVTIQLKFGKFSTEKEYLIPETKAKTLFNIVDVINVTRDRMSVRVANIKRLSSIAVVTVKNFALRRNKR